MDRNGLEAHLSTTLQHIAHGLESIERVQRRIAQLSRDGQKTAVAVGDLFALRASQRLLEQDRDVALKQLKAIDGTRTAINR